MEKTIRVSVLKARGDNYILQQADDSSEVICEMLRAANYEIVEYKVLPDNQQALSSQIRFWGDRTDIDIILTIGGVGLTETDCMPEATLSVSERVIPGVAEYLRSKGALQNSSAVFNRGVAVTYKNTLIINLHGGPHGAKDSLAALLPLLQQGVFMMNSGANS